MQMPNEDRTITLCECIARYLFLALGCVLSRILVTIGDLKSANNQLVGVPVGYCQARN